MFTGHLPTTVEAITTGLVPGNRNKTMYALACKWWREYGLTHDSEVYGLAHKTWAATPGHDTFGEREVAVAVESARRSVEMEKQKNALFIEAWRRSRRG